jgi:hypothetical protein
MRSEFVKFKRKPGFPDLSGEAAATQTLMVNKGLTKRFRDGTDGGALKLSVIRSSVGGVPRNHPES